MPSHAYPLTHTPLLLTYPAQAGPIYMDDFQLLEGRATSPLGIIIVLKAQSVFVR